MPSAPEPALSAIRPSATSADADADADAATGHAAPPAAHPVWQIAGYIVFAAVFVALEPLIAREVAEFTTHNFGKPASPWDARLILVPLITGTALLLASYIPLAAFVFRDPRRGAAHVLQFLAVGLVVVLLASAADYALLLAGLVSAAEHDIVEPFLIVALLYMPLAEFAFRPSDVAAPATPHP
ncbi:hypothetical protein [Acuticoccus sediminis]|uniref:hypothetical protein n=1 Tax=Acuticoccus sediminis TaxID=2184697 RepID=UPI001CFDA5E1|nr:hypothetical protein [Acuticoccus sediminis]